MASLYKLRQLDPARKDIRVVRLLPGEQLAPIELQLEVVSLLENPSYVTVSYAWEPSDPKKETSLDGQVFVVGKSLSDLLHAFRDQNQPLVLWIDALCINQKDIPEKESQIELMKDIYSQASHTLIWIGQPSSNSQLAMDYVRSFQPVQLENLDTDPEGEPWAALRLLVRRKWWSRLWVLQEVCLSATSTVCCGGDRVPFSQFVALRVAMQKYQSDHVRAFGGLQVFNSGVPLEGCMLSWEEDRARLKTGGIALAEWMTWTSFLQHTVPHDRIYGLLGLVTERERKIIKIKYSIPLETLYTLVAVPSFLSRGLEMLHYGFAVRNLELPSWVPDFTGQEMISYFDKWYRAVGNVTLSGHGRWARFAAPSTLPQWRLPDINFRDPGGTWVMSTEKRLLAVRAIILDAVQYADAAPFVEMYEGADLDEYERRRIEREDRAVEASARWEAHVSTLQDGPYALTCGKYEALWRTIIADRRYDYSGPPESALGELFEIWMRRAGPADRVERRKAMFEYYAAAITRTAMRAFITTDSGYFGLAPAKTRRGDVVAILKGGPVPLVLRPATEGMYEFVGECYVHGAMQGETLNLDSVSQLKEIWLK